MLDLKTITNNIIKKSFPELKGKNLEIYFRNLDDALMKFNILDQDYNNFAIEVDDSLKKANNIISLGGMAHELCHFSRELSLTKEFSVYDGEMYEKYLKYRIEDERNTDKEVIKRGYGEHLLALAEYNQNILKRPYVEESGLSIIEIKSLLSLKNKTL